MRSGGSSGFAMLNPFVSLMSAGLEAGRSAANPDAVPGYKAVTMAHCEMVRLMSRRTRAYMELPATLSECRSPQDMFAVQQAFWQRCAADYTNTAKAVGAFWSVALPVTGVEETLEDESLQSCPDGDGQRDIMPVGRAATGNGRDRDRPSAPQQAA